MTTGSKELTGAARVEETHLSEVERYKSKLDQYRSRLEKMDSVFAHVSEAILVAESDSRIIDANLPACAN